MSEWVLGIIGGSGVYAVDALEDAQQIEIATPWGKPSDALTIGTIEGVRCVFLPRHGHGHRLSPTDVNSRANIDALKRAGCTDIVSIAAVGSLREELAPGHFLIADQFIDRTFAREKSFFGPGLVAHVSMARPVCERLSELVAGAAEATDAEVTRGGIYLAMEGPHFSTRAESELYRAWGCDVIGMTAMPEAKLAREAELPYAIACMVTDYDCWRDNIDPVEVSALIEQLQANAETARRMIVELVRALPAERPVSPIDLALNGAIITAPAARYPAMIAKLDAVAGRVLRS